MPARAKSPANPVPKRQLIQVKTTPELLREFGAACKLRGSTIQETINGFMERHAIESGIRPTRTT